MSRVKQVLCVGSGAAWFLFFKFLHASNVEDNEMMSMVGGIF